MLLVFALAACGSAAPSRTASSGPGTTAVPSSSVAAHRPSTSSTTSSSTTVAAPAAPARALHTVLLLGDSEMFDAAPFATEAFKAAGVEVNSQAFPGTSLLGASDVTATFAKVVSDIKPDAVVLLYTGAYFPPLAKTPDGRDIELATPEFFTAWTAAAAKATRTLQAGGAEVYWVLLPQNEEQWNAHDTRLDDAYLALASKVPGVHYVDWRHTIVNAPNGAPLAVAPIGPGGTPAPVRGADGRHFSADASRTLANVMVSDVLKHFSR